MMDSVKREVARKVASLVKDTNWNVVQGIPTAGNRVNTTVSVTGLETLIMVWTRSGVPRHFIVNVREQR